jgi:hypothetical protein
LNLQREVSLALRGFVTQMMALAQKAAIATLESTLRSQAPQPRVQDDPPRRAPTRGSGPRKRSRSDLEALTARLVALVEAHPGLRVEEINRRFGTEPGELALPIRQLKAQGILRAQGHRRSTRYSLAQSSATYAATTVAATATRVRAPE